MTSAPAAGRSSVGAEGGAFVVSIVKDTGSDQGEYPKPSKTRALHQYVASSSSGTGTRHDVKLSVSAMPLALATMADISGSAARRSS